MENNQILDILRNSLPPEFTLSDAAQLLSPEFKAPEKYLESLVLKHKLIRLKRGLYVLAQDYEPLAAAGAIASPSYVSFETALAFYGLIPERSHSILSVIDGRALEHRVGDLLFLYRSQRRDLFAKGMSSVTLNHRNVLISSPEKALLDTLAEKRLKTAGLLPIDVFRFVCESLRIESDAVVKMSVAKLKAMAKLYRNRAPLLLVQAIEEQKRQR